MRKVRPARLLAGLLAAAAVFALPGLFSDLGPAAPQAAAAAAVALLMAVWWLTEALPIYWTALVPVVAYPNAGGTWDARTGEWRAASGLGDMSGLLRGGVRIVGGCCGTDAEAISALAGQVARTAP